MLPAQGEPGKEVPLPPVRPQDPAALVPPKPAASPAPPVSAAPEAQPVAPPTATNLPQPADGEIASCDALLAGHTVKAERMPSFGDANGCGIAVPVKLAAVLLPDGSEVPIAPAVTVRCAFAASLADWVRLDLNPLLAKRGGLAGFADTGGYECRGRNRVVGAKMSEHALGNAMDIGVLRFRDGTDAKVTAPKNNEALFAQVKLTACARFATVLGPGSDGYHENHMHVDIETRRHGAHYCHWQLPQ